MNTQLPTLNRQGRSLTLAATMGLGFARHPMVSRAGNRFTLVDAAGNQKPLALMDQAGRIYIDLVIFDASPHPNRLYFEGVYDPSESSPPDCFSDNGIGPSTQARNPQGATCSPSPDRATGCPHSIWGSRVTAQGQDVPACQVGKKLAVLVVGDPSNIAYEFRVPPGSFSTKPDHDPQEGGWTWYVNALKGHGAELFDVVTRVSFIPNTTGKLLFKPVAALTPDLIVRVNDAWERKLSDDLIGLHDRPRDPSLAVVARTVGVLPPPPQPVQPQPGIPAQFIPGTTLSPATFVPAPQPPGAPGAPELARKPRRTKAQIEADDAMKQQGLGKHPEPQRHANPTPPFLQQGLPTPPFLPASEAQDGDIPAFLRRQAPTAPPAPQHTNFGIEQPKPMPDDLAAALDKAFELPK